jgi:arylsulfatase
MKEQRDYSMNPNLLHYGLSLMILAMGLTCVVPLAHAREDKPNVVVMLADNLGYGDLGSYGSGGELRGMPTPRIDRLASEGLRMSQFFVEAGCTPSRAGLMTGRYSPRSGLGGIIVKGTPATLQDKEVTMAELFKSKGYATAMAGKWHLGAEQQSVPTNQGFDEYHVGIIQTTDSVLYPDSMKRAGMSQAAIDEAAGYIWESQPGTKKLKKTVPFTVDYRSQVEADIATASVEFIKRQSALKQPFFLYIGWSNMHYPVLPHPDFLGKSSVGWYGDAMMELDYRTGQVLDALKDAGVEDNTIVVWLSDNGPVRTNVTGANYMGSSAGPFRGETGDVLEGQVRVPAMIKWPQRIKPRVSNEIVSIHDFFPTLANMIGAKVPTDRPIDGRDQTAFFTGQTDKSARDSVINFIGTEIAAVRWRNYRIYPKQVVASVGSPPMLGLSATRVEGMGFPAIFDILRDQTEQWNLTPVRAWVVNEYLKVVGEYQATLKDHPNPPAFSLTEFKQ